MQPRPAKPPGYKELAVVLRDQIISGQLRPGDELPSETELTQTYGVSRPVVWKAMWRLRSVGLIVTEHGRRSRVRVEGEREVVRLDGDWRISARMPTWEEAEDEGIPEGVPVIVVSRPGEADQLLRADGYDVGDPSVQVAWRAQVSPADDQDRVV